MPPVFSGSRPPDFTAPVFAVLGVPSAPSGRATSLDADRGRGGGDFRVPTVRNVGRTAPYFHNGRYATLEQVVDFYDRGGGKGIGVDVPNQDPEIRPLHLSAEEKRVLLVFLREALSPTPGPPSNGATARPPETFPGARPRARCTRRNDIAPRTKSGDSAVARSAVGQ